MTLLCLMFYLYVITKTNKFVLSYFIDKEKWDFNFNCLFKNINTPPYSKCNKNNLKRLFLNELGVFKLKNSNKNESEKDSSKDLCFSNLDCNDSHQCLNKECVKKETFGTGRIDYEELYNGN